MDERLTFIKRSACLTVDSKAPGVIINFQSVKGVFKYQHKHLLFQTRFTYCRTGHIDGYDIGTKPRKLNIVH